MRKLRKISVNGNVSFQLMPRTTVSSAMSEPRLSLFHGTEMRAPAGGRRRTKSERMWCSRPPPWRGAGHYSDRRRAGKSPARARVSAVARLVWRGVRTARVEFIVGGGDLVLVRQPAPEVDQPAAVRAERERRAGLADLAFVDGLLAD